MRKFYPTFSQLRNKSILVVEDDEIWRLTIAEWLSFIGAHVSHVDSAQHAQRALGVMKFDLIITDIVLKGGNGFLFAEAIRDTGCECPIIGISSDSERYEEMSKVFGLQGFMQKPLDKDAFIYKVCELTNSLSPKIDDILN